MALLKETGQIRWYMRFVFSQLSRAVSIAAKGCDRRYYRLGAVGLRKDGTLVASYNGLTPTPDLHIHAEYRLCRKLDLGATVYVARVTRDGQWAMARPCQGCMKALEVRGVEKVYYTICDNEFGCVKL